MVGAGLKPAPTDWRCSDGELEHCPEVERDAEGNGGRWVFAGTGVPLYTLYETLASGATVHDFAQHCDVEVEQAVATLRYEAEEFRADLLIRPDGPGEITPIPAIVPSGAEIPDWHNCPAVERIAGKVSGAWIFTESRLPLWAMYSEMASGTTIDQFVDWYYGDRAKVIAALEYEAISLRHSRLIVYAHPT